ncbi:MAG: helix-hairpin-helix domain-containing protein [Anaerolineae bacterium]
MKEKQSTNFLIGFILGAFICAVVWYWQKSTAADEGALDLLDRMAELDRELRQPKTAVSPHPAIPMPQADDLQQVKGIGPVFDGRLRENGIHSIAQLAALSAEKLADLLEIGENRAEAILADAAQA